MSAWIPTNCTYFVWHPFFVRYFNIKTFLINFFNFRRNYCLNCWGVVFATYVANSISVFVACMFRKRNLKFLFEGAISVKKNSRVRDPVSIASESFVLGVITLIPSLASLPQQIWERFTLHIPFRGSCHCHSICSMYQAMNTNNLCREKFSVF